MLIKMGLRPVFFTALLLTACGKEQGTSFVFSGETPPEVPVITSPTPAGTSRTLSNPVVKIIGCFNPRCTPAPKMRINAIGEGTLNPTETGFTFDAILNSGEMRTFSFTTSNAKGETSAPASVSLSYQSSLELLPTATLFMGGAAASSRTMGHHSLNFLTSLPSLVESPITANGLVLTSGALNPQ